jgi:rhamnogalacturonan endolyase
VTLTRNGTTVVLANGIITATLDTTAARVKSLQYKGREMVSQQGRHKTIYFFVVGDRGKRGYEIASPCVCSVRRQTPDLVDISCKRPYAKGDTNMHPWDLDTHFVLRRGTPGLYVYSVVDHPAHYPELNIGQYLMVWSMPYEKGNHPLEKIYVDEARHWELPAPGDFDDAEVSGIKEIALLKSGSWKGRYDCKYMYTATYRELGCWGFASDRHGLGAWVVFGSHEYFNDGPTMSDLTSATGILHVMFNMNHYNGTGLRIPKSLAWQKERAAWPYAWMAGVPDYPVKEDRGVVAGRLVVKDALKPALTGAKAWVGLAQPAPGGNWQFENHHYQYWERANTDGDFVIPHVRPGTYSLYAFVSGAVGEFSASNIVVQAGAPTLLNEIAWNVPHPGAKLAWEIGVPDRTAREFRHGDDYFKPLLWDQLSSEFPNPLEYTIGVSDASKDWNYAHCGYPQGTNWSPWKWRIHFKLDAVPAAGSATLTLAYASSYYGNTEIYVNDESKMVGGAVHPSVDGGNALIREGIHAKYCVERVAIPLAVLRRGTNTLTLVQGQGRFDRPFFHVMYDYLSLELPAGAGD